MIIFLFYGNNNNISKYLKIKMFMILYYRRNTNLNNKDQYIKYLIIIDDIW